jgi:hypothetical protein
VFLRVLQLVHVQTAALVEDLKTYELPVIVPRSPQDTTEFRRSLGAAPAAMSGTTSVSAMLESAMEELFAPYTEGQRYIDKECKCLTDLYAKYLSVFAKYHVSHQQASACFTFTLTQLQARAQAGKPTVLGRMMNQIGSNSGGPGSGQAAQAAAALMRFGGLGAAVLSNQLQSTPDKPGEDPIREEDGLLSVDAAEKLLKWHAEAIGRCVEMTASVDVCVLASLFISIMLIISDRPKHTFALLRVLSETLGNGYAGTALERFAIRAHVAWSRGSLPSPAPWQDWKARTGK